MLKLVNAFDMPTRSVENYYVSFRNKDEINCLYIIDIAFGPKNYLDSITKDQHREILFYLVDDQNPEYILGFSDIHPDIDNYGNIGYGVRPSVRNQKLGTIILYLTLKKCHELGFNEITISHLEGNIYSEKIIKNNKGQLLNSFFDPDYNTYGYRYKIKLNPSPISQLKRALTSNKIPNLKF